MPSRARWSAVVALSVVALLIQGAVLLSLGLFLPAMAADFGRPAGGAVTALLLAMSGANLAVGRLLERIGARRVLAAGILLSGIGCLLATMATDRLLLAGALAIAGAGVGLSTIVPGIAIITRLHSARRGLALAFFLSASVVAGSLVPPFVGIGIRDEGWRVAMLFCGGASLACLILLPAIPAARISAGPSARDDASRSSGTGRVDFRHILWASILFQLAINGVLFAAVDGLMAQGLTSTDAVMAYSLANLLGLPALLGGGILADRIGPRPALIGTALLLAVGTLALLAAKPWGVSGVAAFVLLWGVASALPGQSGSMLLADVVEADAFPRLLGLNSAVMSLIGSFAPLWTDQMRAWSGGYGLPVLVYAVLALAAAPIVARVGRSKADAG